MQAALVDVDGVHAALGSGEQRQELVERVGLDVGRRRAHAQRGADLLGLAARQRERLLHGRPPLLEAGLVDVLEQLDVHETGADLDGGVRARRQQIDLAALLRQLRLEGGDGFVGRPELRAERAPLPPRDDGRHDAVPSSPAACFVRFAAKYSSARLVLVCCSPWRSTPRSTRKWRTLTMVSVRSAGRALGGELQDAAAVGVEPHLEDELVGELRRRERDLEHEDGPEDREIVQLEPLRRVRLVEGALLLVERLAHRRLGQAHQLGRRPVGDALVGRRADEAAGHGVHLDAESVQAPQLVRDVVGPHRPQLDDRVRAFALDPAGADHHARLVQRQVGRVEERHQPDLALERIDVQLLDRRAVALGRYGQLQLDALRALDELEQLEQLVGVEADLPQIFAHGLPRFAGWWD